MACPNHPDKTLILKDDKMICPECGWVSSVKFIPSQAELLKQNEELLAEIKKLKADVEFYKKQWLSQRD